MNRYLITAAAAVLTAASPAFAASPFDGTWKGDMAATQLSKKPNVYLLNGGTYSCPTCVPAISVPADAAFHPVSGSAYADKLAITVVDANTIKRVSMKGDKRASESTAMVSADGKSLTVDYNDMSAPNGVAMTGKSNFRRVAAAPTGAHMISGSWEQTNSTDVSDSQLVLTMALEGDTLRLSTPSGVTYAAKIGGPAVPVTGDPGWTSVTVKRDGKALIETDFHDGKTLGTYRMTVSADGKTLTTEANDLMTGKKSVYVARKM